jgi:hypothetical protein
MDRACRIMVAKITRLGRIGVRLWNELNVIVEEDPLLFVKDFGQ